MKAYKEALEAKIAEAEERIQRWEHALQNQKNPEHAKKTQGDIAKLVEYFTGLYDGLMTAKFLLDETR